MKVRFRAFTPADVASVRLKMAYALTESTRGIVAYDPDTAETLAVFIAEGWTDSSVSVHQIIFKTMVLRHGWLEEIATFIFTTAARKKMYGMVPASNHKAISLNEKIGFKQVARLEQAVDENTDYIIMELKREDCPYWKQPALRKVS